MRIESNYKFFLDIEINKGNECIHRSDLESMVSVIVGKIVEKSPLYVYFSTPLLHSTIFPTIINISISCKILHICPYLTLHCEYVLAQVSTLEKITSNPAKVNIEH